MIDKFYKSNDNKIVLHINDDLYLYGKILVKTYAQLSNIVFMYKINSIHYSYQLTLESL